MVEYAEPSRTFCPKDIAGIVKVPEVSLPTLVIAVSVAAAWLGVLGTMLLSTLGPAPLVACVAMNTICTFIAFTPMHDAAHGEPFCLMRMIL